MTNVSRPSIREMIAVLSLLFGCVIVIVELLHASSSVPLAVAAGLVVVFTVSGGLSVWWRARPKRVADHVLALLVGAMTGFLSLMVAVGAVS